jgi:alpha-tubulin suppressor-like RCC1 family protein
VVLSAGKLQTCAITGAGVTYCWGHNTYGELGDGTSTPSAKPVPVAGGHRFVALSAGVNYTCALTSDSAAWCWGDNDRGQLGVGVVDAGRTVPTRVVGGHAFGVIAAGGAQTCALDGRGGLWCWGAVLGASTGGAAPPLDSVPRRVDGRAYRALGTGSEVSCALTADSTFCWGNDPPGVFLDSVVQGIAVPKAVPAAPPFVAVSTGGRHVCGLSAAGRVECWGSNVSGEIGAPVGEYTDTPTPVAGGLGFAALSGRSPGHNCGVTVGHAVYCWGANGLGQLGDGSTADSGLPVRVMGGDIAFVSVAVGYYHSCGVATDASVLCWGMGSVGQLGTGDTASSTVPRIARFPKTQ